MMYIDEVGQQIERDSRRKKHGTGGTLHIGTAGKHDKHDYDPETSASVFCEQVQERART